MALPERRRCYTYADYPTWPEDERWELIDGVPYAMAPAPGRRHQEAVGEIFHQFADQLEARRCRAYVAPSDMAVSGSGSTGSSNSWTGS